MHVYSHIIVHDDFHVGDHALLPTFWSVDDTSIMCAHASDSPIPSIPHDHEYTVASMFPTELLGILPSPTYRDIKPPHWSLTTRIQPLLLGANGRRPVAFDVRQHGPDISIAQYVLKALHS